MHIRLLLLIFIFPTFLSAQLTDIFVSSRGTHSVKRYNGNTGQYIGDFVTPNSGTLNSPQDILFHPNGNLLVVGRFNNAVKMYNGQTGAYIGNFTKNYPLDNGTKMSWGPEGYLYISQWGITKSRVVRFDSLGNFIDEFTQGNLNQAGGHAWDDNGNLYVAVHAEGTDGNILRFDTAGVLTEIYIPHGVVQGPIDVWFRGPDMLVQDLDAGEIIIFDAGDKTLLSKPATGLNNPEGHVYDPSGLLYVCESGADQVLRYNIAANTHAVFINSGGLSQPNSIVFEPGMMTATEPLLTPAEITLQVQNIQGKSTFSILSAIHSPATLTIFDVSGKVVATPFSGNLNPGEQTIFWLNENYPSGVYFYKLSTGGFSLAGKIIIGS
ncbi:MAG: T9SS type A sorting domain-containing protein [Bacteroidia bacterium]